MSKRKQRPAEMRGLWRRGKVWWAVIPLPGGERVRQSLGTEDLGTAIEEVRRLRGRAMDGDLTPRAEGLDAVVDLWISSLEQRGISDRWVEDGRYAIRCALERMEVTSMAQLSTQRIQKWHAAEARRTSPHTAATYLRRISSFCVWAVATGRMRENPAAGVRPPPTPPRLRRSFLSREQSRDLIDRCEDEGLKFALYCALHAGLRRGEISAARPNWFDLEAGLLHVQNTPDFTIKDRDDRTIPLTAEFRAFLQEYGLRKPYMLEPKVKPGKSRYRFDIQKRWQSHRKKCGLEDYTFHDLRRTFASLLASSGVSLFKIAKWLGDGVEVVEARYAHLIAQDDDVNRAWHQPQTEKKPAVRPRQSTTTVKSADKRRKS